MEINSYQVFVEVAQNQSVSKAAEKLGYTQSGISHTIRRMEADMQLKLFERGRTGVKLTSAGEDIFPYVRQVVQDQKALEQTVSAIRDLHKGTLNIGSYSSISRHWLPAILHKFKELYPEIEIHFKEGGTKELINWLENREVDLVFGSVDDNKNIEWIPIKKDTFKAVLYEDYPFKEKEFPLESFNREDFIISALGVDYEVHHTLKEHKIKPNIQYSCLDDTTIIAMIEKGLGISILPNLVLRNHHANIKVLPIIPSFSRTLGIGYPSENIMSPICKAFIDLSLEFLK